MIAIAAYEESAKAVFDDENDGPDEAANAPRFGWKRVAGLASVLAVVAVGWNMAVGLGGGSAPAQLAQMAGLQAAPAVQPPVVLVGNEPQTMLRDARLDALLAAHKQVGGTSALQVPAGFLRNATFESSAP